MRWLKAKWRAARRFKYWLRCRVIPAYRHHVVYTGLTPDWHDCDERMLHACMALLVHYVEWECGGDTDLQKWTDELRANPDPYGPQDAQASQADTQDETLAIYRWWKVQRPADQSRRDEWCSKLFGGRWETWIDEETGARTSGFRGPRDESMGTMEQYYAFDRELDQRDQEMLHRLIDNRGTLWT